MKHLNGSEYFPQICLNSNIVMTGVDLYHDIKNKLKHNLCLGRKIKSSLLKKQIDVIVLQRNYLAGIYNVAVSILLVTNYFHFLIRVRMVVFLSHAHENSSMNSH